MGLMTLDDFRDEIAGGLQRTFDDIGLARLDRWIMNALFEFGYAFKFRELEGLDANKAVTSGLLTLTIPADWRMWHELGMQLYDASGKNLGKLLPETREIYLQKINLTDASSQGQPTYYHQYSNLMYLRPVPDGTYSLNRHYWKKIPVLVVGATTIFKDEWDDIVSAGGLYRGLRFYGEYDRYLNVKNDFLSLVRSRVMEEDLEQFPEGGIMPYPQSEGELQTGI